MATTDNPSDGCHKTLTRPPPKFSVLTSLYLAAMGAARTLPRVQGGPLANGVPTGNGSSTMRSIQPLRQVSEPTNRMASWSPIGMFTANLPLPLGPPPSVPDAVPC